MTNDTPAPVDETGEGAAQGMAPAERIRDLTDILRTTGIGGKTYLTRGVIEKGADFIAKATAAVRSFDAFSDDNDPWQEHDCATLDVDGESIIFKIDLYERAAVKHYSIAKPLLVSRPPAAGRRFRIVRSWPCASAHRLVSGESAQAPSSHNQYSRMPSPENTGGEPNYYWAASSHQSSRSPAVSPLARQAL